MYYEVYIPSEDEDGFDTTITVEAENWMSALKSGLERTGEGADAVRNVMCDIKDDNSIHVTDATTQRVFVLEELGEEAPEDIDDEDVAKAPSETEEEIDFEVQEEPSDESDAGDEPVPSAEAHDGDRMRVGSQTQKELKASEDSQAKVVGEERKKTDRTRAQSIGRSEEKVSESIIEDMFLEIQPIHSEDMDMEEAVNFVLDLAMDKIDAESGSILFADVSGQELYFAAARGPKADEIMDFRVPMGEGIVGFCSREGVSLAIGDAQEDPRFYEDISESLGYPTDSLLCSPIQYRGRVYGAVELVNKKGGSTFTTNEMNALSYVGRQMAEFVNRVVMERESLEEE
jgi:hypothetical protein